MLLFLMDILVNGTPVGIHLLLNLYNITNVDVLKDMIQGRPLLEDIVRELELTVVSQTGHQFSPIGYSYAYVLSESHFTIHTYPEHHSCYIDIFCCNPDFNGTYAANYIKRVFNTMHATYQIIRR